MKISIFRLVLYALFGALFFAVQIALAPIPNVELVSVLILVTALSYGTEILFSIYIFAILEGLLYGFGIWWIMYLYVWTILALVVILLKNKGTWILWCLVLAFFGLAFGALCSLPYLVAFGPATALAWWIEGIPYDLMHCAGNFASGLIMYKPLMFCMKQLRLLEQRRGGRPSGTA